MSDCWKKRLLAGILFLTGTSYLFVEIFLLTQFKLGYSKYSVMFIAVALPGGLAVLCLRKVRPLAYGFLCIALFNAAVLLDVEQILWQIQARVL